jgi:hypothetical protein
MMSWGRVPWWYSFPANRFPLPQWTFVNLVVGQVEEVHSASLPTQTPLAGDGPGLWKAHRPHVIRFLDAEAEVVIAVFEKYGVSHL